MLTQQRLHELFDYRDDGTLVRRKSGKPVVCNMGSHRYLRVHVDGKAVALHRVIYLYHHGVLPDVVDHADNDRSNNRIENLREATQQENCLNRARHSNSRSPFKNVYWSKAANKWSVQITANGRRKYLGVFSDIELADLIAQEARNVFHGNFANHGGVL
jgi:hypothetical protein